MDTKRNHGLDIFRLLCMVMITVLHVNNQHFGLLGNDLSGRFVCGYFIEYLCFCGVNGFAMLSGFLMCGRECTYDRRWFEKTVSLWLQLVLWGLLIYLAGIIVNAENFSGIAIQKYLLPATSGTWWYMSAYFGLLMLLPPISAGIDRMDGKGSAKCSLVLFVFFSVMTTFDQREGYLGIGEGYSTLWLIVCFFFGAMLRKNIQYITKMRYSLMSASAAAIVSVIFPFVFHIAGTFYHWRNVSMFFRYTSPFCVLEAAALLVICSRIEIRRPMMEKMIGLLSANALGIYLFQNHPLIWDKIVWVRCPSQLPAGELLWRFPLIVIILLICGLLCNAVIRSIYEKSRLAALPGLLWSVLMAIPSVFAKIKAKATSSFRARRP